MLLLSKIALAKDDQNGPLCWGISLAIESSGGDVFGAMGTTTDFDGVENGFLNCCCLSSRRENNAFFVVDGGNFDSCGFSFENGFLIILCTVNDDEGQTRRKTGARGGSC